MGDAFESEHMPIAGRLLRREKQVQRYHWVFLLLAGLFGLGGLLALLATTLTPLPLGLALLTLVPTLLMLGLWATFSVLRVHLSDEELLVRFGPFGPRIALGDIESCRLIPRPAHYRGGGVRLRDGMWEYSYMMNRDMEQIVEVVFVDRSKRKRMHLTSTDPAALVRTVEAARAALVAPEHSGTRDAVRIGADGDFAAEADSEAQAAAQADGRDATEADPEAISGPSLRPRGE